MESGKIKVGDGNMYQVLVKTYSQREKLIKTTRAFEVGGIGCVVQATIEKGKDISESVVFVANAIIVEDINSGKRLSSDLAGVIGDFAFVAVTGAELNTVTVSEEIVYSWTRTEEDISVSGGLEYSVNGGDYTTDPGKVYYGDKLIVRITSSDTLNTEVVGSVVIGLDSAQFSVTTKAV